MIYVREYDLQTMCLKVIAQYIEYLSKPNKSTEIYVDFLQRCYSDRLHKLLLKKGLFPEQYIEWLLTLHWKNVLLPTCVNYPINKIISKLQVMGHSIVSLDLDESACSADILSAIICCVPNVTSLNLRSAHCTDNLLSLIRKMCISLHTLNLSDCKNITDAGMANLCNANKKDSGFDSLKVLNILKTPVTQKGVILLLKHLPSIQWLTYEGFSTILFSLHKSDVYNNPVRYNLRNFEYAQSPVSLKQVLEVWTVMCPFVTRVSVQDKIDGNDLRLIKKFQCLKKLIIENNYYFPREIVISPFITLHGPMLTELEIMHVTVSVALIVKLCYNLKKIFFFNVTFEDFSSTDLKDDVNVLNNLTSLTVKHLNFQRDFAFKSIFLLIKASKNLNELYIHFVEQFSNTLADIIFELPKLTVLDFLFIDIEVPALQRFFTHKNLTKIRTDGCVSLPKTPEISDNHNANTCAWMIDYSETSSESGWDCSVWSGDNCS